MLDKISIIEKDNFEYIHIYSNEPNPIIIRFNINENNIDHSNNTNYITEINRNISIININKSRNSIKVNDEEKDMALTNDKLENKSEGNQASEFDFDDENEIKIIKKINF